MKRFSVKRFGAALGLVLAGAALATEPDTAPMRPKSNWAEDEAVQNVLDALDAKDCARAVERLNRGLAKGHPRVFMLAGGMYEEGLCLKPNWERAVNMYLRADQAGDRGGPLRLVAGYAKDRRDPAAALFWAHRSGQVNWPHCQVDRAAAEDPDRFVAVLRTWPRERLDACVYVLGVMARVTGDVDYPMRAKAWSIGGTVQMRFSPAAGTIEWNTVDIQAYQMGGLIDGTTARDQGTRRVHRAFDEYLRGVSDRALKAYERPAGLPDDLEFKSTFTFTLVP